MINKKSIDYALHYSKWHEDTSTHSIEMINAYKGIFDKHIKGIRLGTAIDIGCGMGFGMSYLTSVGFKNVYGYDIDKQQVKICISKKLKAYEASSFIGFAKKANLKRASCDFVLATDFIEHLSTTEAIVTLKNVSTYLKKDGVLMLTTPNANSAIASRYRYIDLTHENSFTEHSIEFLLKISGFKKVVVCEPNNESNYPPLFNLSALYYWILRRLLRLAQKTVLAIELGQKEADKIPLTPNLLVIAMIDER